MCVVLSVGTIRIVTEQILIKMVGISEDYMSAVGLHEPLT